MTQVVCKLCGKTFVCNNGRWSTTCTCAKDRPDELRAAQQLDPLLVEDRVKDRVLQAIRRQWHRLPKADEAEQQLLAAQAQTEFYKVRYNHAHGDAAVYHVECAREPTAEEVVKALDLDFEPDQGETIEIVPLRVVHIRT